MHKIVLGLAMLPAAMLAEPDPGVVKVEPSAEAILKRALECAERAERESVLARYTARHTNRTLKLDRSGKVSAERLDVFLIRPVEGEPFYELLERDGKAATARDLRKEAEKRERFRDGLGEEGDAAQEAGLGFALSQAVLDRYQFRLTGKDPLLGWSLAFEPKPGEIPMRRQIDQVLNRLEGTLWIDADDFGLTQAEFSLREPLRIWYGMLGSLSRFDGRFEQVRLAPGHWLPGSLRLEMDGWAPFHSLRQRVDLDWTDYAPTP